MKIDEWTEIADDSISANAASLQNFTSFHYLFCIFLKSSTVEKTVEHLGNFLFHSSPFRLKITRACSLSEKENSQASWNRKTRMEKDLPSRLKCFRSFSHRPRIVSTRAKPENTFFPVTKITELWNYDFFFFFSKYPVWFLISSITISNSFFHQIEWEKKGFWRFERLENFQAYTAVEKFATKPFQIEKKKTGIIQNNKSILCWNDVTNGWKHKILWRDRTKFTAHVRYLLTLLPAAFFHGSSPWIRLGRKKNFHFQA